MQCPGQASRAAEPVCQAIGHITHPVEGGLILEYPGALGESFEGVYQEMQFSKGAGPDSRIPHTPGQGRVEEEPVGLISLACRMHQCLVS